MEISEAVERQRRFFDSGRTREYAFRRVALKKLAHALQKYEPELIKALQRDLGKSRSEAYMTEIGLVREELSFHLRHLAHWVRGERVPCAITQFPAKCLVLPEPYGVTLIMAPWNYPVLLCLQPLISALAAGNCVLLKPSAYAPATAKTIRKMLKEIYPSRYVEVICGGREENRQLLDCRFDKIFFTGGKTVGKLVLEKAAENLTPVTLELGGKSPCILDETADVRLAARRIAFGKLLNSGQTCVAPDYVLLPESLREKFIYAYHREVAEMLGDAPLDNPEYPRMVSETHYDRVFDLIRYSGRVRSGGYGDREALKIAPTLLDEVTLQDPVMKEEIFGPVLPVITVSGKEEILQIIHHFDRPLACYLFSCDKKFIHWALKHLSFGGGCINDTVMQLTSSRMPFGGVGGSGMGSYHGKEGFRCFSHDRSIVERGIWPDIPLRYHPYEVWKENWTRRFLR